MTTSSLAATRRALHAVAELLLAGPQLDRSDSIELRVTPGGFGTVREPLVGVRGTRLVVADAEHRLDGRTVAEVGAAAGIEPRSLDDVYDGGPHVPPDEVLRVVAEDARLIADAFDLGQRALTAFAPQQRPVLWPEHFDLGVTVDEVNYGLSPGDDVVPVPYAYVGPWTVPARDDFWNAPFGAYREVSSFAGVDDAVAFLEQGRSRALPLEVDQLPPPLPPG